MKGIEVLPRRHGARRWGPCAVLLMPAAVFAAPDAPPPDAGCAWPVADSVEALLQAETEAALRARRGMAADRGRVDVVVPGPAPARGPAHADRVAVAAIYGVGRRLHVDVRINGQIARYRKDQRWPEHAPGGGAGVYALAAVLGECVHLQGGDGARIACLDAGAAPEARRH
ncbi:hypothetical protein [Bordetella genomosp. 10]|nr:hypothetical protein [Bordetella genomosp. 10]